MRVANRFSGTEYEKIRRYVITQLAKEGAETMRLASSRELAKEFGVAQTTVVRALKDLIQDGYLTVKPRMGIFTNPGKFSNLFKGSKSFAMLFGDGRVVFPCRVHWDFAAEISRELLRRSSHFLLQSCFLSSKDPVHELKNLGFDGVIWIYPHDELVPTLVKLKESGMSVLSIGRKIASVSSISVDAESLSREISRKMLAEGKKRLILLGSSEDGSASEDEILRGVEAAFSERGLSYDRGLFIDNCSAVPGEFTKVLLRLRPDGIIFNIDISRYWADIQEAGDAISGCLYYSSCWPVYDDMDYSGLLGIPDLKAASRLAIDNILEQVERKGEALVLNGCLEMKLQKSGDLKR